MSLNASIASARAAASRVFSASAMCCRSSPAAASRILPSCSAPISRRISTTLRKFSSSRARTSHTESRLIELQMSCPSRRCCSVVSVVSVGVCTSVKTHLFSCTLIYIASGKGRLNTAGAKIFGLFFVYLTSTPQRLSTADKNGIGDTDDFGWRAKRPASSPSEFAGPCCATEAMATPARLLRSSLSQGRACHLLTRRLPVRELSADPLRLLTAMARIR
jgi:hypothetical protein